MTDLDTPPLAPSDARTAVRLADVGHKPPAVRTAVAAGRVLLGAEAYRQLEAGALPKGDALTVAQVAGVLGAKQASRLLPLCHDVLLRHVELTFELDEADLALDIRALVKTEGPTGVEMEALTAVSVAALTVYDLCKSVDRGLSITDLRLLAKTGGQSGDYRRDR